MRQAHEKPSSALKAAHQALQMAQAALEREHPMMKRTDVFKEITSLQSKVANLVVELERAKL